MTYVIVLFSIIVLGATVGPMIIRAKSAEKTTTAGGQMGSEHQPVPGYTVQDSNR